MFKVPCRTYSEDIIRDLEGERKGKSDGMLGRGGQLKDNCTKVHLYSLEVK